MTPGSSGGVAPPLQAAAAADIRLQLACIPTVDSRRAWLLTGRTPAGCPERGGRATGSSSVGRQRCVCASVSSPRGGAIDPTGRFRPPTSPQRPADDTVNRRRIPPPRLLTRVRSPPGKFGYSSGLASRPHGAGALVGGERQDHRPGFADSELLELRATTAPPSPGVYAVLDARRAVQYIGLASSLSDHAACIPEEESRWVKLEELDGESSREQLQACWKSWIKEHGAIPPGNRKGETKWSQKAPEPAAAAVPLRAASDHRWPAADALVTQEVVASIELEGYAILDGVLGLESIEQILSGLEELKERMRYVDGGSQIKLGRQDMVCILDETSHGRELLVGTGRPDGFGGEAMSMIENASAGSAALAQAVALLKGLPMALMERSATSSINAGWLPTLAVPHSLMLAVYPGEGARYVAHLDNDVEDPRTREGPPGQRICDRAITSILYFNPDWSEADGGFLRIQKLDGSGHVDVAPEAGRLVLFQSKLVWHEVLPSFRRRWALSAWIPKVIEGKDVLTM